MNGRGERGFVTAISTLRGEENRAPLCLKKAQTTKGGGGGPQITEKAVQLYISFPYREEKNLPLFRLCRKTNRKGKRGGRKGVSPINPKNHFLQSVGGGKGSPLPLWKKGKGRIKPLLIMWDWCRLNRRVVTKRWHTTFGSQPTFPIFWPTKKGKRRGTYSLWNPTVVFYT